ncbi:MAG: DNA polymerase III subunit delta, partial [Gammaproteobacteria bacterium]|nr:DNA polymerase III subunit delta [Gammaproteobacteria bacterium]
SVKIPANKLDQQLARGLGTIYLVSGDEPLLVAEASDCIRSKARDAGFAERELHVVERGFDWASLGADADNLSLFSRQRIIELRLSSPRPGDAAAKTLVRFAEQADPDRLVLVVAPKLDASARRSKWAVAIENHGVHVQVWPLERRQFPAWIKARAVQCGLKLTTSAVKVIAERTEGNLLAAAQELDKLAMLLGPVAVDEAAVLAAVSDSARFDVFSLSDAALGGQAERALRILGGLQSEGVEPVLVLWSLARDVALLARLHFALSGGANLAQAMQQNGVWSRRQGLLRGAVGRLSHLSVARLVRQIAHVDQIIKGVQPGSSWDALADLVLNLARSNTQSSAA